MKEAEKYQVNDFYVSCPNCDEYIETNDNYYDEEISCPECNLAFMATECMNKTF